LNPIIATLVRHGLTIAAGVLGSRYGVSVEPDAVDAISAGVCAVIALAWSIREKRR
jgi:hypothetical protein